MPVDTSQDETVERREALPQDIALRSSAEQPQPIGTSPDPMDESSVEEGHQSAADQPVPFSSNEGPILPASQPAVEEEKKDEPEEEEKQEEPEVRKGPLVY